MFSLLWMRDLKCGNGILDAAGIVQIPVAQKAKEARLTVVMDLCMMKVPLNKK
jgi:hypothetical protein